MSSLTIETNVIAAEAASNFEKLQNQLQTCPKCQTKQKLVEGNYQKPSWGGSDTDPENKVELCAPCNAQWLDYGKANPTLTTTVEDCKMLFDAFLLRKEEHSREELLILQLKEFTGLRMELQEETLRFTGRYTSRSKRLDELKPLSTTRFLKAAQEDTGKDDPKWLDYISKPVSVLKTQKTNLENIIAKLIYDHPVWTHFGEQVPGLGSWTTGFLMAQIGGPQKIEGSEELVFGPTRFADSGKLRSYAGLLNEDGNARKRTKEQLNYSPKLKTMVVKLLPEAMSYQKTRFPDSPYSKLFEEYKQHLLTRVQAEPPTCCPYCKKDDQSATTMTNLGWEEREGKQYFKGYQCSKNKTHIVYSPAHIMQMVNRKVGQTVLGDLYHFWLYVEGENPNIEGNPRIMWALEQYEKKNKK